MKTECVTELAGEQETVFAVGPDPVCVWLFTHSILTGLFPLQFIFICKTAVTIKIPSRCFTETQDLTPQQATVALKKIPFNTEKPGAGPGSEQWGQRSAGQDTARFG